MMIFISGGCKNGKSSLAQEAAAALAHGGPLYYVATMIPRDAEDRARVARHLENRAGMGFTTVECGRDILRCLDTADAGGCFLLDSVTALLDNEMFASGAPDPSAPGRVASALEKLTRRAANAVFVSDYLYGDAQRFDGGTECYRRGLAEIDRRLAACCDTVVEVCAGLCTLYKGGLPV